MGIISEIAALVRALAKSDFVTFWNIAAVILLVAGAFFAGRGGQGYIVLAVGCIMFVLGLGPSLAYLFIAVMQKLKETG